MPRLRLCHLALRIVTNSGQGRGKLVQSRLERIERLVDLGHMRGLVACHPPAQLLEFDDGGGEAVDGAINGSR